jgi:hypothetical protein
MDVPNVASGCQGSIWLFVFWLLCAANIVAAFYMSVAIQRDDSILPQTQQQATSTSSTTAQRMQQNAHDGTGRMKQLFCYDGWMALYILVALGFLGWLFVGAVWFATGTLDDSCDGILDKIGIAYGFGWAFVCFGGCALMGSICCHTIFEPPRASSNIVSSSTNQQQQQQTAHATTTTTNGPDKPDPAVSSSKPDPAVSSATNPTPSAPSAPPMAEAVPIPNDDNIQNKSTYTKPTFSANAY